MLSRVAERVYWAARYLERISRTARLISIYESVFYDLPKNVELSWYSLIEINDLENAFNERYTNRTERNIVKFLLGDTSNASSLIMSLKAVRENVRTTRNVVPEEAWELICELSSYAQDHIESSYNRKGRHEFLENIIKGCLQINGLLFSAMPHDAAWEFLHIGRNLERADMTSRYLEAGLAATLELEDDEFAINAQQIIWGSVLRSLSGTQYYLQAMKTPVKGPAVVEYLLSDTYFPMSITRCIHSIIYSCENLPRAEAAVKKMKAIEKKVAIELDYDSMGPPLLEYLNELQIQLSSMHAIFADTWFNLEP